MTTRVLAGTSGFQYPAWRGGFYPAGLKTQDMLAHYGTRLGSVEINQTFYRMPKPEALARWAEAVPADFRFAIKASQRITHRMRLKGCQDALGFLLGNLQTLGDRLGAVLFQLPPNFKVDLPRLAAFVAELPQGTRAAFEFRHPSWWCDALYQLLADRDLALCIADVDAPEARVPWHATASYGYLRLRRDAYDETTLAELAARVGQTDWKAAYVYFKHEQAGPQLAAEFTKRCAG